MILTVTQEWGNTTLTNTYSCSTNQHVHNTLLTQLLKIYKQQASYAQHIYICLDSKPLMHLSLLELESMLCKALNDEIMQKLRLQVMQEAITVHDSHQVAQDNTKTFEKYRQEVESLVIKDPDKETKKTLYYLIGDETIAFRTLDDSYKWLTLNQDLQLPLSTFKTRTYWSKYLTTSRV